MSDDEYCEKDFENFCRHENYLRNKERIKKYQVKNKDKLKEYSKKYYHENKEAICKRTSITAKEIRTVCCGKDITKGNYWNHLRTKEHKKWLQGKFKAIHRELLEKFK